jgi:hypothetical protein
MTTEGSNPQPSGLDTETVTYITPLRFATVYKPVY